jgi:pyruvate formate lyase activating enzyme
MLDTIPTPLSTLRRAREIAMNNGLRYVYTGNVTDPEGSITICANCNRGIIARDWYAITEWYLNEEGNCQFCGSAVPGVFRSMPGTWGNRRLPVSIR